MGKVNKDLFLEIMRLYKDGYSISEIAQRVGLNKYSVRYILRNKRNYIFKFNLKENENTFEIRDLVIEEHDEGNKIVLLVDDIDYSYFQNIKRELQARYGDKNSVIADEFVFYKLLETYREVEKIKAENKKLKKILGERWGVNV